MTQFRSRNSGFDPASRFILFENLDSGFGDCVAIDLFCIHIKSLFETVEKGLFDFFFAAVSLS
jgi:hypothetical protein